MLYEDDLRLRQVTGSLLNGYIIIYNNIESQIRQALFSIGLLSQTERVLILFFCKLFLGLGFECGLYVKELKHSLVSEDQNKLELGDYIMKVM